MMNIAKAFLQGLSRALRAAILAFLWLYKRLLSPFMPPACRFHPTCSEYAAEAFRRRPLPQAAWLSVKRLAKCGPWHPGGYDPLPDDDACRPGEAIMDSESSL